MLPSTTFTYKMSLWSNCPLPTDATQARTHTHAHARTGPHTQLSKAMARSSVSGPSLDKTAVSCRSLCGRHHHDSAESVTHCTLEWQSAQGTGQAHRRKPGQAFTWKLHKGEPHFRGSFICGMSGGLQMAYRLLNFKQGLGISINNESTCILYSIKASKAVSAHASC